MCGINGIVKINGLSLTDKEKSLFTEILKETEVRGTSATGVFLSNMVYKIDKKATNFVRTNAYKDLMNRKAGFVLGHNRQTTVGTETVNCNNHPFLTERFVFAHNGMFHNYISVKKRLGLVEDNDIETDTYVMLQAIEKYVKDGKKVHEAIQDACKQVNGTLACWLYDKRKDHLYLFRRTSYYSSPLNIVAYRNMLIFCSDIDHIKEGIKKLYGNGKYIRYELGINEMLRIDTKTNQTRKFELPESDYHEYDNYDYNKDSWDGNYTHGRNTGGQQESVYEEDFLSIKDELYQMGLTYLDGDKGSRLFKIEFLNTLNVLKENGWCVKETKLDNENKVDSVVYTIRVKNNNIAKIHDNLFEKLGHLVDVSDIPDRDDGEEMEEEDEMPILSSTSH